MRKRQLFYDLLLFSSVLGVSLVSQITPATHNTQTASHLSLFRGTIAKAATTTDFDTQFAKYSDINNTVDTSTKPTQAQIDAATTSITNLKNQLIARANSVTIPTDSEINATDFATVTAAYNNYLEQNVARISKYYTTAPSQQAIFSNLLKCNDGNINKTTPSEVTELYYKLISIGAIQASAIQGGTVTDVTDPSTAAKAFVTKYPDLATFGNLYYSKGGLDANTEAKYDSKLLKWNIVTDPKNVAIDEASDSYLSAIAADGRMVTGAKKSIDSEKWSTAAEKDAAKVRVDNLATMYKELLKNATQDTLGVAGRTWQPAFYAISGLPATDAQYSPAATDDTRLAAIGSLNQIAQKDYTALLKKLAIDPANPTSDQQATIDTIKTNFNTVLEKYADQIKTAKTQRELDTIANAVGAGTAYADLANVKAGSTVSTDDIAAAKKTITDAATAQIASIKANTKATDDQKTAAIDQINSAVTDLNSRIDKAGTTELVNNIAATGVTMIKTITFTSDADSSSSSSDASKDSSSSSKATNTDVVTASQKTNAINALITTGNNRKVAIQNDTSLTDAQKTAAYTAIDGLVTTYTNNLNAATNQEAFTAAQITALMAVNGYNAATGTTKSATDTTSATTTTSAPATTTTTTAPKTTAKGIKVVYATAKLSMYSNENLTHRTATYAKRTRANRPEFTVLKQATNDNGTKVYYVKNNASGRKGYISASSKYTSGAYYKTSATKVKVISKHGVNAYKKVNLSGYKYHYKKNATLKIKRVVKSGLTTRFQLTNGTYVSANKIFVYTIA
ncbi:DUF5776 domain-containing protein [Secundilactobacillus similis]|uniref:DUF5776 domain-containing protein n=1 Tax=Secundilactobacillus similis DSM 23365 = JCM 2765 TaxID=1423804 RepID=A0A0R2FE62_9LACO|nr:DUF5776 domain-containing protein [Secundilactobacillus similis]KRN23244.1 hypothetical protein FD14_GL000713 [Secundilactobacillus similis DSM 23365 = JCM 2765]